MNENMILHTVPAANDLHKVPGFDPMKYLRKTVNSKGEPVMKLAPHYQRLWFRLACPKGRMLLNPLRVTDQMAIFEAKVFFHQKDAAPASSFTATKTARETAGYIRAAQDEALMIALDNAGFGIQLCDVAHGPSDSKCCPTTPAIPENGDKQQTPPEQMQTEQFQGQETPIGQNPEKALAPEPAPVPPVQTMKASAAAEPAPKPVPVAQDKPASEPISEPASIGSLAESSQTAEALAAEAVHEPNPAPQPVLATVPAAESQLAQVEHQETPNAGQRAESAETDSQQSAVVTMLNFSAQAKKTAAEAEPDAAAGFAAQAADVPEQVKTPSQAAPSYTEDMTVEEICQVMTMEEAGAIVVSRGPCKGLTMAQVAERRPSSLRFFLTQFSECSNSQKAAATLLIQALEQKKAG